jgi:hypothetical protein
MILNIVKILEQYRDKSYILANLSNNTANCYLYLKNFINIPLILLNGVMSVLNAIDINHKIVNYSNIFANISITFVIIIINNYQIYERYINYKNLYIKYTRLTHIIEDKLANNINNCTIEDVKFIIKEYETIYEYQIYPYPKFLINNIKNKYIKSKRTLPYILYNDIDYKDNNLLEPIKNNL